MRSKRFSSLAGWAAVALVAAVGFAAFGGSDLSPEVAQSEAAAASLGHTAGAYAGLNFVTMGTSGDVSVVAAEPDGDELDADLASGDDTDSDDPSAGTTVSPSAGWLSEVEVRAFVSLHFEPADINQAVRVAWCESRFDPNHHDLKTGGVGLFNHLPRYWDERSSNAGFAGVPPTDAEASTAAAAWEVYNGGGWDVFNCR